MILSDLTLRIINETVKPALIYFVKVFEGYMSNYEEKKQNLIAYLYYNIHLSINILKHRNRLTCVWTFAHKDFCPQDLCPQRTLPTTFLQGRNLLKIMI